ncbi:MAG: CGNR zinc finger domain-containing protein [Terriglobales bacterium]|jgi:predicted RNA-binding Zn ribbon-like protein
MQKSPFEFISDDPALDFVNTVDNRNDPERRKELLNTYSDLLAWATEAHLLTQADAEGLKNKATKSSSQARAALRRAKILREALYRIFSAIAEEKQPSPSDVALLDSFDKQAMAHRRIGRDPQGGYGWQWRTDGDELDIVLWQVAKAGAELLTSDLVYNVRACAAEPCRWLFVDMSRNHKRRWCDMRICGNREKVRRFQQRVRKEA